MTDLGWSLLSLLIFFFAILVAVAWHKNGNGKKFLILATLLFPISAHAADFEVNLPPTANQGSFFRVEVKDAERTGNDYYMVRFIGVRYYAFLLDEKTHIVLVPVDVDDLPGSAVVKIFGSMFGQMTAKIEIKKTNFSESPNTFIIPPQTPAIKARRKREQMFLENIYLAETPERYFSETLQFADPLEKMEIVTPFGEVRHKKTSAKGKDVRWIDYHKGVDLRASVGTLVFAAEKGRVVAARSLLGSGNTVIIDHGYGLLSLYFHLSKIKVKEGAVVKRGQKIGIAGMSGNAQGPHLHFEIRLHKIPVNPLDFLKMEGVK